MSVSLFAVYVYPERRLCVNSPPTTCALPAGEARQVNALVRWDLEKGAAHSIRSHTRTPTTWPPHGVGGDD